MSPRPQRSSSMGGSMPSISEAVLPSIELESSKPKESLNLWYTAEIQLPSFSALPSSASRSILCSNSSKPGERREKRGRRELAHGHFNLFCGMQHGYTNFGSDVVRRGCVERAHVSIRLIEQPLLKTFEPEKVGPGPKNSVSRLGA